jgi:glycosyltransferase involved in cell wall biosynthesis
VSSVARIASARASGSIAAPIRLTVVTTHPVQYATPWFRHIAQRVPEISLTVLYATQPTPEQQGVGFGDAFAWDVPLTDGYRHRIVRRAAAGVNVHSDDFWGVDVPEIGAAIAATTPDVVLIPGWHSVTLVRALWACRWRRIPVLYRGDSNLLGMPSGWRGRVWAARTRMVLRSFDGYLSVGARAREYLRHFGVPATSVFDAPHCVDNDFFAAAVAPYDAPDARRAARLALGLDADAFVVLFVGKLEDKKRPMDLIRAVAAARPGMQLLMVGAGPLALACQDAAQRLGVRAVWPGFLNQSELGKAYAAANCLVLPSDARETWGLVVNEALATGLPCVVSDRVGCAPDLVSPGVTGEVFPVGDQPALTAALHRLRDREGAGHAFAPACRARAVAFSFAAATVGLLAGCRALVRPPRVLTYCGGMVIVSGLERSTFEVLRVLRERGAALHCVVNCWENERIVALAEQVGASWSTAYHWYPFDRHTRNPLRWAQALWDILMTSLGLLRDAFRFRPTHVLLPEFMNVLRTAPALALLRLLGISVILRVGNAPVVSRFYCRVWRVGVVPFVDHVVCNSQFAQRALQAAGVPAGKLLHILSTPPGRVAAAPHDVAPDPDKVIYVGQIIPEKGLDVLLDAIGLLVRRGRDVRLDVVGAMNGWVAPRYSGYREQLLARAAAPDLRDRVCFLGQREDVPALLAAAAVHCCPSRAEMLEGLPLVTLEAKQVGLPSVAFAIGPFPELIAHRTDGWLCEAVSAAALADGLEYFLVDGERRRTAGEAARRSMQRFQRQRFADDWWGLVRTRRHQSQTTPAGGAA